MSKTNKTSKLNVSHLNILNIYVLPEVKSQMRIAFSMNIWKLISMNIWKLISINWTFVEKLTESLYISGFKKYIILSKMSKPFNICILKKASAICDLRPILQNVNNWYNVFEIQLVQNYFMIWKMWIMFY
jgi:hypothetical protein